MSTPEDKEPKYKTQNQYEAWVYIFEKIQAQEKKNQDFENRLKALEAKE